MRFLFTVTKIKLKQLCSVPFIIMLAVIPLVISSITFMADNGRSAFISVGVMSDGGESELIGYLKSYMSGVADITEYDSLDDMQTDILRQKIEFGYVFHDSTESLDGAVTIYKTEASVSHIATNVTIASLLIQTRAGEIGYETLHRLLPDVSKEDIIREVTLKTEEYLKRGIAMDVEYVGKLEFSEEAASTSITAGLFAVLSVMIALISAAIMIDGQSEKVMHFLSARRRNIYSFFLSNGLVILAALLVFDVMYFTSLKLFGQPVELFWAQIAVYDLALASACGFITTVFKREIMPPVICYSTIACVLFSNQFVAIDLFFPALEPVKYLFVNYHFSQSMESAFFMLVLAGITVVFAGLTALFGRLKY